jgi:excinuclease UvrABC helicase subunit UvrB
MFGRRKNLNGFFGDFDAMFNQFDSIFNGFELNKDIESGSDEMSDWSKETYKSPDGSFLITSFVRTGGHPSKPNKTSGVDSLKTKLKLVIEEENFEEAVKLRDEIKKFESNQGSIKKLELELKKSIEDQNFERSIELREELKKLKS